ncbi:histidine kinase [Dactylosporangium sp. NBC_01737]|uniref:sensor histidine kinase n=1 Tax=Dactylosporangium sp. NBC_01737 TaxID=2975959 RepID=UPI002E120009|nr:histidine kinase [Dactylosporangium sp. NBC_01737]
MLTRLFDERYAVQRLALLALCGLGYVVLLRDPAEPRTWVTWATDAAALLLTVGCVRWPFAGALALAAVVAVADVTSPVEPVVPVVGASWAVLELALRVPGRRLGTAVAALCVVHLADDWRLLPGETVGVLYNIVIMVGVPVLFGANIRSARQIARQAEERAAARERRHADTRAARADERTAIARELHDVLAHHVASIVLRVGVARHVIAGGDPRTGAVLDDVHATGSAALADLRRLLILLRDPHAPVGDAAVMSIEPAALPAGIAAAVDRARGGGVTVETAVDPAVSTLDAIRSLAVLRLVQEGLTNVARHAGPDAHARVSVTMRGPVLECEVTDDGNGADHKSPPGTGHGIIGMRERVDVIGGTFEAGPTTTGGWRMRAALPPPATTADRDLTGRPA